MLKEKFGLSKKGNRTQTDIPLDRRKQDPNDFEKVLAKLPSGRLVSARYYARRDASRGADSSPTQLWPIYLRRRRRFIVVK